MILYFLGRAITTRVALRSLLRNACNLSSAYRALSRFLCFFFRRSIVSPGFFCAMGGAEMDRFCQGDRIVVERCDYQCSVAGLGFCISARIIVYYCSTRGLPRFCVLVWEECPIRLDYGFG